MVLRRQICFGLCALIVVIVTYTYVVLPTTLSRCVFEAETLLKQYCVPSSKTVINGKQNLSAFDVIPKAPSKSPKKRSETMDKRSGLTKEHVPAPSHTVLCTQDERLARIDEMCERYHGLHATHESQNAFIENMTDEEIVKFTDHYFVVPEFRVMGCLNFKTACTSWRIILLLNSFHSPTAYRPELFEEAEKTGRMKMLSNYPPSEIRTMLKTYFKFATVRHPFSRLLSAYKDKVLGRNDYGRALSMEIARKVRRNHKIPKGANVIVTFGEFLKYIQDGGKDIFIGGVDHWHTLMSRCQPCRINYDHVVRMETMEQDARYIVQHKMRGQAEHIKYNVHGRSNSGLTQDFKDIHEEFAAVPDSVFHSMLKRYKEDMDVYGYNFSRSSNSKLTCTCSAGLNNGHSCC